MSLKPQTAKKFDIKERKSFRDGFCGFKNSALCSEEKIRGFDKKERKAEKFDKREKKSALNC